MEGGRSGDNDGERGGETTVLVRGMNSEDSGYDDKNRRHYRWVEFYKVDLKEGGGEVEKICYPKLLTWKGPGEMLRAGPKLYIIGGLTEGQPDVDDYTCASVLDMKEEESCRSWKQFMLPIKYPYSRPRCASLDGKIYHFEYPSDEESLDPPSLGGGFWEFIWCPPQLANCKFSGGLVPDPGNNRILLNMSDGYDLYAYYPLDRTFKLVGGDVYPWSHVIALADDVAYVHQPESSQIIYAFDLSDGGKSLDVVWTSKVLSDTINGVVYDVNLTSIEFDALLHVGNSNFWFYMWSPDYHDNTRLYFIKFKVRRRGDQIICTPLAVRSHLLESTCKVFDLLLLEEASG